MLCCCHHTYCVAKVNRKALTSHQILDVLTEEEFLPLCGIGTGGAQPHRVQEAHSGQLHASVTARRTAHSPTPPAVVLGRKGVLSRQN